MLDTPSGMETVITSWLLELLQEKQSEDPWRDICMALTQPDSVGYSEDLEILRDRITIGNPDVMGPFDRPYYLTMARTLTYCFEHGELPANLVRNPVNLLHVTNKERYVGYDTSRAYYFGTFKGRTAPLAFRACYRDYANMSDKKLLPEDWRIFLHLRTTTGGSTFRVMPPSLEECLETFTRLYQKPNAKPRRHGQPYQLTVGAKALSKHWHRDRQEQFWGKVTGSETQKNEHANEILIKILSDPVWVNLHTLPHNRNVYEIRHSQGYGVRWTTNEDGAWEFRGFLEPQMEDGHSSKWIH